MNKHTFGFVIGLLLVAFLLVGCGGGGGSKKGDLTGGGLTDPGIKVTVLPDTAFQGDAAYASGPSKVPANNSEQQIGSPLDKGATIEAFDFETKQSLGKTTVGDDGKGTLTLPAGKTVLIVVTGKRDGKDYRLSAIIPFVEESGNCYVGPAQTLAAEAIGQKYYGETGIDDQTWQDVLDEANNVLNGEEEIDFSIGGGFVAGTDFGAPGSIDEGKAGDIIAAVPAEINSKLIKAKHTVKLINQTAIPLQGLMDQEYLGVYEIAAETYDGIQNAGLSAFVEKYTELGRSLGEMVDPLVFHGFEYEDKWEATLNDLEIGKKYKVDDDMHWHWKLVDSSGGTAGVITIIREIGDVTLTMTAKKAGGNWEFTQTSSADAQLNYTVSMPNNENNTGNWAMSFKDKNITDPITFNGSVSAAKIGNNKIQATYSGKLISKEVELDAKVTAIQEGNDEDGGYMSKLTLQNLSAKYAESQLEASVTAAKVDVSMQRVEMGSGNWAWYKSAPASYNVENLKADITADGKKSSLGFSGKIECESYKVGGGHDLKTLPTKIEASSLTASLNDGSVLVKGSLSGTAEVKEVNGEKIAYPTKFSLTNAEYTRKDNTSLMGSFVGEWKNPGVDLSANHINGTINVDARLQRAGYEDLTVDLKLTADGAGNVALVVNRLGWQNSYFTGSGAAVMSAGYNPDTANLTLTSNTGVVIEFTDKDMNGSVKVDGEQQGAIAKEGKAVKVTFTDDFVAYLIGNIK